MFVLNVKRSFKIYEMDWLKRFWKFLKITDYTSMWRKLNDTTKDEDTSL